MTDLDELDAAALRALVVAATDDLLRLCAVIAEGDSDGAQADAGPLRDTWAWPTGPSGLESVDYTLVDAGSTFDDLDPFAEAVSKAEVVGAQITAWVTHPTTLLALAQLKKLTTGSNEPLLQPDPTMPTRRQILGVPLYWSPYVDQGAVWGVPGARTFVVLRSDAELVVDPSAYFSKDSLGIRSTMRVGFGFPHPEAIVRVGAGGS